LGDVGAIFLIALLTSAAVPAATAAFFNVLVKLLDGFVVVLVVVTAGFAIVDTGFVVVVLAATGVFGVVVLAATGAFVVVVLAATGAFVVVFAATAGFLIAEVIAGLGLACGARLVPVCTRETGAPEVVPREVGIATPSDTGARPEIVSRGARETDVRLPKSS
jgi:hypothetical protein